jgi:hypothetical protein
MKIRDGKDMLDFRTALWVAFWLVIIFTGDPDMHDAILAFIGRH